MDIISKEYKYLNEKLYTFKDNSGITLDYIERPGYIEKATSLSVYFGSNDTYFIDEYRNTEYTLPKGIAHFMEHKIFEQKNIDVIDYFSENGADLNAYTTYDKTAFEFSCIDNFYENLKNLLKFIFNPYFTNRSIKKEKKIIEQEIMMNYDNPNWILDYNMFKALYHNNPVKYDIAGTVESINAINTDNLYTAHKFFYNPQNTKLVLVGDLDFKRVIDIVRTNVPQSCKSKIILKYPDEPSYVNQNIITEKFTLSNSMFSISIKENNLPRHGIDGSLVEIGINLIIEMIFGESSDFFDRLYSKNLLNEFFDFGYEHGNTYSYTNLSGESPNPKLVYEEIKKEIDKINKTGLNYNDFRRLNKSTYGRMIQSVDSVSSICMTYLPENKNGLSFFDYCLNRREINFDFIKEIFNKHFDTEKMILSILEPL
jgi:predicted Zn-dependent peptidase